MADYADPQVVVPLIWFSLGNPGARLLTWTVFGLSFFSPNKIVGTSEEY